eukprot:scaffold1536_cov148-Chaetoceros_neogracile.AAC.2
MDEIETAVTAFLDSLDKDYDYAKFGCEKRGVGVTHHRKIRGRLCSTDWSLSPTDHLIESHQQMDSTTFSPVKDADVVTSQLPDKSTSKTSIRKSKEMTLQPGQIVIIRTRRGSSGWVVPLCIRSNNISMAGSSRGTKEEEEYD